LIVRFRQHFSQAVLLKNSNSDFGKIQSFTWFRKCISGTFSFWAHFHPPQARLRQVKTALFGAARFRAPATSPPQGAPCLASQPLQSLARLNALSAR
jgi:hypothetical protein